MNKYVFDKQTGDFKVAGLIEIDKSVFYLKALLDYNSCDGKGTQSDEEQRSSLKKQENIFFNLLTKKENIQKRKDYDHNTITTKSCEKQAAFLEIYNKDEGGFTLPTPALSRKLPKYKPFKDKAIPALDQYLKSEGKSVKLLYAYSITRSEGFGDQKEKRFIGVTGVKQDVYIGRFTQFAVVAENLKPSTGREDNWNSKSKYAYFVVNIVEPVSDKSIDRLTPPNPNDYSGKYELMGTSSMPFFLNSEENTKVMQFKED